MPPFMGIRNGQVIELCKLGIDGVVLAERHRAVGHAPSENLPSISAESDGVGDVRMRFGEEAGDPPELALCVDHDELQLAPARRATTVALAMCALAMFDVERARNRKRNTESHSA